MKRFVKQIIAGLMHYSGLLRLLDRRGNSEANFNILTYHRVLPVDDPQRRYTQQGLVVSPEIFDRQMEYLARHYRVISLSDLVRLLRGGEAIPPQTAVITFDDGWRDNYVHAMPILRKHSLPATVFLTTDFIGTGRMLWFFKAAVIYNHVKCTSAQIGAVVDTVGSVSETDLTTALADRDDFLEYLKSLDPVIVDQLLGELEKLGGLACDQLIKEALMVSWDEVAEMLSGGMEMGSHGCSHRIMTLLDADELRRELSVSKREIEAKTGRETILLAYPNGNCSDRTRELALEAGYGCALSTSEFADRTGQDIYSLPRIGVHEGMSVDGSDQFSASLFAFGLSSWGRKISKR